MKPLLTTLFLMASLVMNGQNIQLHFDFGKAYNYTEQIDRRYFTSTVELFKPDKLGSTFLFVDVDYDKGNGGASLAYFEIARKFTLHQKSGLGVQIEFNDGTPSYIRQAWLVGFCYPVRLGPFTLHTSWLYRANQGASSPDAQITAVWNVSVWKDRISFSGFVDVWSQDKFFETGKELVLLAEPQGWYNLNPHLSLGGEVEISHNFFTFDGDVAFMPTLAIKYSL